MASVPLTDEQAEQIYTIWQSVERQVDLLLRVYERDPDMAEDLKQEVFIEVAHTLLRYGVGQDVRSLPGLVFRIVRRTLNRHIRRQSLRRRVLCSFDAESHVVHAVFRPLDQMIMDETVQGLTEADQWLLDMMTKADLDMKAIAEFLRIDVTTLYRRLNALCGILGIRRPGWQRRSAPSGPIESVCD